MGGLIKVHTRSPFSYQGTDVKLSYGTKSNYRSASSVSYTHLVEEFQKTVFPHPTVGEIYHETLFAGCPVVRLPADVRLGMRGGSCGE